MALLIVLLNWFFTIEIPLLCNWMTVIIVVNYGYIKLKVSPLIKLTPTLARCVKILYCTPLHFAVPNHTAVNLCFFY